MANNWGLLGFPGTAGLIQWNAVRRPAYCTSKANIPGVANAEKQLITISICPGAAKQ